MGSVALSLLPIITHLAGLLRMMGWSEIVGAAGPDLDSTALGTYLLRAVSLGQETQEEFNNFVSVD